MTSRNKVPPDGGYGWVVTFAYALNNSVVLPLIAGFGLVFQEAFDETGLSATQGTLVITLNHGIGMLLSFFGGPVLRRFGYRKVAVIGAIFICVGLMMTAAASNFWIFILSYSIINSTGVAAVMATFALVINSFFKEKRGRAIGVAMSLTGLGAIYMPKVMSALMYAFGWRYAVLILAALGLHSLIGACLLRPAKWYLRDPPNTEEEVPLNRKPSPELINESVTTSSKQIGIQSVPQIDESLENLIIPAPKILLIRSFASNASLETRNAVSHSDIRKKTPEPREPSREARYKWWESQDINLGSSFNIFIESETKENTIIKEIVISEKTKSLQKTFLRNIVDLFDLTLLSDPIFVNILVGMSVAAGVETNFSLLFPIILKNMMKFETGEISDIMAMIGFSDTVFRLVSPFIGEWWHKPPRVMYMIGLVLIIFTRTIMLFASTYMSMIFVALAIGITKGVRTVYMNIVIPNYVPIERLAFASGILMFVNGITIIGLGYILGKLREASGSYNIPIIVLNVVTLFTVFIWSVEFIYVKKMVACKVGFTGEDFT